MSSVGKSSLLSLLKGRDIPEKADPTVGLQIENSLLNGSKVNKVDMKSQHKKKKQELVVHHIPKNDEDKKTKDDHGVELKLNDSNVIESEFEKY